MSDLAEALEFYGDPDSYTGHEQTVLAAARLVASGEVIAKTDLREIRWCRYHMAQADELHWCDIGERLDEPCRIVSAGLWLEGDTE